RASAAATANACGSRSVSRNRRMTLTRSSWTIPERESAAVATASVASRDQVGETEVALVLAQDQCNGSALRNDAERAGLEHLHVPWRPHGDAIVHVDQAEIVGTADDDAVARGDLLDAALQVGAPFVAVGIAVRIQKEGRDAAAPRLFDQVGTARGRNRKEGRIN